MSRAVAVLAVLAAAQLASVPARAQEGRLEIGGFLGGLSFTQELGSASNIYQTVTGEAGDVDFGELYGLRTSWAFTRNLAAELSVSTGKTPYRFDVDDGEIGDVVLGPQFEADQIFWSGAAVVQFPTRSGFVPYGVAGVGQLRTRPVTPIGELEDVTSTDVSFGGGVKFWVPAASWLGLRVDVRYHTASEGLAFPGTDASPSGTELTIGGSVRLF